jgi:hypothetical protein
MIIGRQWFNYYTCVLALSIQCGPLSPLAVYCGPGGQDVLTTPMGVSTATNIQYHGFLSGFLRPFPTPPTPKLNYSTGSSSLGPYFHRHI